MAVNKNAVAAKGKAPTAPAKATPSTKGLVGAAAIRARFGKVNADIAKKAFGGTSTQGGRAELPVGDGYIVIISEKNATELTVEARTSKPKPGSGKTPQEYETFDLLLEIKGVPEGVDENLIGDTFPMNCSSYIVEKDGEEKMYGMRFFKQLCEHAYGEEVTTESDMNELLAKFLEEYIGTAWVVNVGSYDKVNAQTNKTETRVTYDVQGAAALD